MRRPATLALVAVIILLLGTTVVFFQKYRKSSADFLNMQAAEETARNHYTEAFNAIAEIQDSLNAITVSQGKLRFRPQGLQAEQKLAEPSRQEALESIALLNASIQRTKEKIRLLEGSLKRSGVKIAGMERMIANLKQTVSEKQGQIAELTSRVDSLQTRVAGLETTVQQDQEAIVAKDQTIEEKRRELGTIYYVIGTKKDLANSGIIVAKGGVLGMGKTLQLSGHYNENQFTALDTDQETVVRASGAKAQVLSPQPTSSYELKVEGGQVVLRILDPKEFRKIKHLVIMTA